MIQLLTVCTGNICRSPFAERMLQAELDAVHPGRFAIRSAGTEALVGHGMEDESAALMAQFGGSASGFSSRQVTPEILGESELVIVLTVAHRDAVVRMSPRMLKRSYTLIELARILKSIRLADSADVVRGGSDEAAKERWARLASVAAAFRSASKPSEAGDDVVDPYRRSPEIHQQMVEEILPAVEEIVAFERWASRER